MINVSPAQEPANFDLRVRQRGLTSLKMDGINPSTPLSAAYTFKPYWRDCIRDLHSSYNGICAYLCIRLEWVLGGVSTDHFIPKSIFPAHAYEWDNYRLSSSIVNSRKGTSLGIIDPFKVKNGSFHLELLTGKIFPSSTINPTQKAALLYSIKKLGLDSPDARTIRVKHFHQYIGNYISRKHLSEYSPFVYMEAKRQQLL